jgi:hypothetical protein
MGLISLHFSTDSDRIAYTRVDLMTDRSNFHAPRGEVPYHIFLSRGNARKLLRVVISVDGWSAILATV